MALPWEENYQTESAPAPAPAPKKVVVQPVPMPLPAASAPAPNPNAALVAAMQTRNATAAAAPVAPAMPALPPPPKIQPNEAPVNFKRRLSEHYQRVDQIKMEAVKEAEKAAREAAAPAKKRDLGSTDINRITELDDSLGVQNRLAETFKPNYAGYKVKFAGDIANTIASTFGGDNEAQAEWWKAYDANDNLARAATYGATLTPGETAAWERTTVNISMTPSMIERRMKERAALIEAKRKTTVENLGKANFNVENFQTAPSNFSPAPVAAPPAAALKEGHVTTFKNGQQWILKNGKPEKVN
tara:strand:+ start:33 stop:935 length:903 start_codon:yes stop_codon:yes gene_type:complete